MGKSKASEARMAFNVITECFTKGSHGLIAPNSGQVERLRKQKAESLTPEEVEKEAQKAKAKEKEARQQKELEDMKRLSATLQAKADERKNMAKVRGETNKGKPKETGDERDPPKETESTLSPQEVKANSSNAKIGDKTGRPEKEETVKKADQDKKGEDPKKESKKSNNEKKTKRTDEGPEESEENRKKDQANKTDKADTTEMKKSDEENGKKK